MDVMIVRFICFHTNGLFDDDGGDGDDGGGDDDYCTPGQQHLLHDNGTGASFSFVACVIARLRNCCEVHPDHDFRGVEDSGLLRLVDISAGDPC